MNPRLQKTISFLTHYSSRCSNCDNAYANSFSEIAERLHVLIKGGLGVDIETLDDIGFTGDHNARPVENKCLDKCKFSKKRGKVKIALSTGSSTLEYQTNLVNVFFAAPFSYRDETIMRIDDIEKNKTIPIICLIGSRSLESGVESLFLSKDAGSDFQLTHGIAIRAKMARFKKTDFSGAVGTSVSNIAVYKDKTGLYCLLKGQSYSGWSLVAYSTNIGELENSIPYNTYEVFSWYKCLIVTLVFSHLGFWSGSLFLIAPFPDLYLLVLFFSYRWT